MTDASQARPAIPATTTRQADLTLEVVLLVLYGVFLLLYGALVPGIHSGALPYRPDSAYGLFLVLVAIQVITLGKTPFGDVRRSWLVVLIGIAAAVLGMAACFVPGRLTEVIRLTVGALLAAGGITLLLQLLLSDEKGKNWIRIPGIPRHIAVACGLVFAFSIAAGFATLFPGLIQDAITAGLLVVYGASFLYLAGAVHMVAWSTPALESEAAGRGTDLEAPGRTGVSRLFREASLPLPVATIVLLAVLLTLLGLVLVLVNLGLLPFSPNGLQGLQLVLFALQMMSLGETPVGTFKRSWWMIAIGIAFAATGAFSCIVPDVLTDLLRVFLGLLNVFAGVTFFGRRLVQKIHDRKAPLGPVPPIVKRIDVTQTVLNGVVIAFGLTMFLPSLVPGLVNAVIIVANGALLFTLATFLWRLERGVLQ